MRGAVLFQRANEVAIRITTDLTTPYLRPVQVSTLATQLNFPQKLLYHLVKLLRIRLMRHMSRMHTFPNRARHCINKLWKGGGCKRLVKISPYNQRWE